MQFRDFLKEREATEDLLRQYLGSRTEWTNTEFKVSPGDGNLSLRRAVCALSHSRGGEVFLGVGNNREVVGVKMTSQQVGQALGPRSLPPGDWYAVAPLLAVDVVSVPVKAVPGASVFVLEVSSLGMPILSEEDGRLHLYIREGESSIRSTGFEAIRWYRTTNRERLLRSLFVELAVFWGRVRTPYPETLAGEAVWLPHLEEAMRTGLLYAVLSPTDTLTLLGGVGPDGQGRVGVYDGVFDTRMQLTRILNTTTSDRVIVNGRPAPPDVKRAFERAPRNVEVGVKGFKAHLQQERMWTDDLERYISPRRGG